MGVGGLKLVGVVSIVYLYGFAVNMETDSRLAVSDSSCCNQSKTTTTLLISEPPILSPCTDSDPRNG